MNLAVNGLRGKVMKANTWRNESRARGETEVAIALHPSGDAHY
jgi:hypothetical protein